MTNEPHEVNQRIKDAAFYLLWVYVGITSLAMICSLLLMYVEDKREYAGDMHCKNKFKKVL